MSMRRPYQITATVLLLVAAFIAFESLQLRYYSTLGPGPGFFSVLALRSPGCAGHHNTAAGHVRTTGTDAGGFLRKPNRLHSDGRCRTGAGGNGPVDGAAWLLSHHVGHVRLLALHVRAARADYDCIGFPGGQLRRVLCVRPMAPGTAPEGPVGLLRVSGPARVWYGYGSHSVRL